MDLLEPYPLRGNAKSITYDVNESGCWICTSHKTFVGNYPRVSRGGRLFQLHRYIYELLVKSIEEDMCLCHKCDNTLCINPSHMFEGTQKENMADRDEKGRGASCERHGRVKLSRREVLEIRDRVAGGAIQKELAKEYGVSTAAVSLIVNKKLWR